MVSLVLFKVIRAFWKPNIRKFGSIFIRPDKGVAIGRALDICKKGCRGIDTLPSYDPHAMRMCAGRWKRYMAMESCDIGSCILHFSYAGIFLRFAVVEQVTPITEEFSLVTLGCLANHSDLNIWIAVTMSLLGLATADGLFYILSRSGSRFMAPFHAKPNAGLMDRILISFQDKHVGTIPFIAMLPKLRLLSPAIAGTLRILWKSFFQANLCVTVFFAVLYMLLGVFFHDRIHRLVQDVNSAGHLLFAALMLFVASYLVSRSRMPLDR